METLEILCSDRVRVQKTVSKYQVSLPVCHNQVTLTIAPRGTKERGSVFAGQSACVITVTLGSNRAECRMPEARQVGNCAETNGFDLYLHDILFALDVI